jgi:hypothetical protein
MQQDENPVIFLHGFEQETIFKIMRAVKKAAEEAGINSASIAFASSTPYNQEWKVKSLIREVRREHTAIQNNAPGTGLV